MPELPPNPTALETLLTRAHDWTGDDRSPWRMTYALGKVGAVETPPRVQPPDWFGRSMTELITHLSLHWAQGESFVGIRSLETLGLVTLAHDDTYVLAMISALGDRWHPEIRTAAIRADAEIRETLIWRVFEVEGGGEVSLANVDRISAPQATWAQSLRDLTADGTLPRERVLASCLQALGRDFSAFRAGWFAQLHRSLDPTVEELSAAQGTLRRLLGSPIDATVSYALGALATVDKAGQLADEPFVAACAAAMGVTAKATVIRTVGIAARIARRRPDLTASVADAVTRALEHPHRDVQGRAFEVLRTLDARAQVAPMIALLEPSVARDATRWLGLAAPDPSTMDNAAAAMAFAAGPDEQSPAADLALDLSLAERGAALLAGETDAFSIELFLAGVVSRPDVATELAPLRKQARKLMNNPGTRELRRRFAEVVLAAVGEPPPAPPVHHDSRLSHLLSWRLAEVVELLTGRRPAQVLLATPTDPAGWLAPATFVTRLSTLNCEPAKDDLVAALLRLTPTGRVGALAAAADVPGEAGEVVRYALGGPIGTIRTRPLWLAAARGRAPFDDDPHLLKEGMTGAGTGAAATFDLTVTSSSSQYEDKGRLRTLTWWNASLTVTPDSGTEYADRPTVVAPRGEHDWHLMDSDWLSWQATVWPHDAEPFFAREFDDVWSAANSYPQTTYGTASILTILRGHPGRLGRLAAATLATGLAAREIRYRALAVDAFLTLVPTGRIPVPLLAEMMAVVANQCPATRWAAALRDAGAEAGPSVVAVLTALLPRLPADHNGLNVLVETLYEEALRLGAPQSDEALRSWLTTVIAHSKNSKAGRVATAFLTEANQAAA